MPETCTAAPPEPATREADARRGRRLEYFTLSWNVVEAVASITAGIVSGSVALLGFGLDAVIESLSGLILLWRLQIHHGDERRELIALRLVGGSFLALAAYVGIDATLALVRREPPESSLLGIGIALVSLAIMPWLSRAKRRVADRLRSRALEADSRQTNLCAILSAILLGGLALNATLGWWWADPVAALLMTPVIALEGIKALRGEACHDCH